MSGQHAPFEEESRGEPSSQMGYSPRDELPLLSSDRVDLPGQKLRAGSLGAATSTTHYLDRIRAVLALLSLISGFVLVLVVIALKSVSFLDLFFVVLFAILALCINLIFAYGSNASPRKASKPKD
jgi:hypothetical protein